MDVSQAQEAKQLREENTRLRKLVADLSLDKEALQSAVGDSKKRLELVARKAAVEQVREEFAFSQRRVRGLVLLAVSSYRYRTRRRMNR